VAERRKREQNKSRRGLKLALSGKSRRGNSVSEKTKPESEHADRCVTEKKRRALALAALQIHGQPEFTRQHNLKWKQVTAQEFQQ
jgi:hypothetical protein